jgi:hypothetical protein
MLGEISRIAALLLIVADLRDEEITDQERHLEAQDALNDIKEKADTPKDWEWDLMDQRLHIGYHHGSYYLRDYTPEECALLEKYQSWVVKSPRLNLKNQ